MTPSIVSGPLERVQAQVSGEVESLHEKIARIDRRVRDLQDGIGQRMHSLDETLREREAGTLQRYEAGLERVSTALLGIQEELRRSSEASGRLAGRGRAALALGAICAGLILALLVVIMVRI